MKRPFPPIVDIPLAYAKEGTPVVVAEVDPATAKSTTDDFSRSRQKALAIPSDVPKSEDIARVVDATLKKFDRIDILVNNASGPPIATIAVLVYL